MINVQHLQYPFYHTIIYNCFEKSTLKSIISELQGFKKPAQHYVDEHHKSLGRTFNTEPFCLDNIYTNKRNKSPILQATQRTLDLKLDEHGASNPFLNYLPMTNKDTTFIQRYRAGSSYPNHHDGSVLTFLYLIKVFYSSTKEPVNPISSNTPISILINPHMMIVVPWHMFFSPLNIQMRFFMY